MRKVSNAQKRIIAKSKVGPVCRTVKYTLVKDCECNDHAHMVSEQELAKVKLGQSLTVGVPLRGQPDAAPGKDGTRGGRAGVSVAASLDNAVEEAFGHADAAREIEETRVTENATVVDFDNTDPGQGVSPLVRVEQKARVCYDARSTTVIPPALKVLNHLEAKIPPKVATLGRYLVADGKVTSPPDILKTTVRHDHIDAGGHVVLGYREYAVNMQGFRLALARYLHGLKVEIKDFLGFRLKEHDIIPRSERAESIVLVHKVNALVLAAPRTIPQQLSGYLSWQSTFVLRCQEVTKCSELIYDSFNYFVYLMIIQAMIRSTQLRRFRELETLPVDIQVFEDARGEGITTYTGCRVVEAKADAPVQARLSPLVTIGGAGYTLNAAGFPVFNTRGSTVRSNDTYWVCGFERDPNSQKVLFNADVAVSGLTRFCGYKKDSFLYNKSLLVTYFPSSREFMDKYQVRPYQKLIPLKTSDLGIVGKLSQLSHIYSRAIVGVACTRLVESDKFDTNKDAYTLNKEIIENIGGPKLEMRRRVLEESVSDMPYVSRGLILQIKDEIFKSGKAGRLVASVPGHGWLKDQPALMALMKKAFAVEFICNGTHFNVNVVLEREQDDERSLVYSTPFETEHRWIHYDVLEPIRELEGSRALIDKSGQSLTRLVSLFYDAWSSPFETGTITCTMAHGDDIWSSRVDAFCPVPVFGELDISSCDASHVTGIFNLFDDALTAGFPELYDGSAISRCTNLFTLRNPENEQEYITVKPQGLILPSGSVLTTSINTLASRWICFVYSQYGMEGVERCGYDVTAKFSRELSCCSFLGSFMYVQDTDHGPKISVASDPAILLRSFGSLPESKSMPTRSQRDAEWRAIKGEFTDERSAWLWLNCIRRVRSMANEGDAMYLRCLRHVFLGDEAPILDMIEFTDLDRALMQRLEGEAEELLGGTPREEAYVSFCDNILRMKPGSYINSKFFSACMHNKYGENRRVEM